MNINELLKVIEYGLKEYRNPTTNHRMNMLEYFSLTDITPAELAKVAINKGNRSLGVILREYNEKLYWALKPLDIQARFGLFHSIRGHELTPDEKLTIKEKLETEGYPLTDGIFDLAARSYVEGGIESISKEQIGKKVLDKYNRIYNRSISLHETSGEKNAVLTKTM